MKTKLFIHALFVVVLLLFVVASAQTTTPAPVQHGNRFVDENGDGYNDNAPDADGDGIPNGQDPDYQKLGPGKGKGAEGKGFVDENGDGINDNAPDADGDGIPNGLDPDYTRVGAGKGKGFHGFVDEDGDGINDRLRDADKDGIPNGQDSDWVRPMDGTGAKEGRGSRGNAGFGNNPAGQGQGKPPVRPGGPNK